MVIRMRIAYNVSLSTFTHGVMVKIPTKIRILDEFSHLMRVSGMFLYLISYLAMERGNLVPNFFFTEETNSYFFHFNL